MNYLSIAAEALAAAERPLNSPELAIKAKDLGLLPGTTPTPAESFRARLSEDIRRHAFHSIFQRVSPGRFALRVWGLPEFVPPPLIRAVPAEDVACIPAHMVEFLRDERSFVSDKIDQLAAILAQRDRLVFLARRDAERRDDVRQLVAYVLLRAADGEKVLTYRRGQFSSAPKMLRGALCLGFGGHVQMQDTMSLFGGSWGGALVAAQREVQEELDARWPLSFRPAGVINDLTSPEGTRHVGIVFEALLPLDFTESRSRRERAVNDLRLMAREELPRRFYEMEYWTQLLVRHLGLADHGDLAQCVTRPRRAAKGASVVAVVGEIAAGKTTLAAALVDGLRFRRVSTRDCVAGLIGSPDFGAGDRGTFQAQAQAFITGVDGPERLAAAIEAQVRSGPAPVIIDGIRHARTFRALRERLGDSILLLYIETSRDLALRNFLGRATYAATVDDFRRARFHKVEAEIPLLKQEADAYVYNGGSKEALFEAVREWYAPAAAVSR